MTRLQKKIEQFIKLNKEYYDIVEPILNHPEIIKRKDFIHHESCSVYDHCLIVSILSYIWTKKLGWDYKSAAIGGLLHDFYDEPWQTKLNKAKKFHEKHGFIHARQAAKNAAKYFPDLATKKVDNIIRRHMFPLNIIPPKYREAWIVTIVDKYTSLDVLKSPKQWHKYLGFKRNKQN